MLMSFSLYVMVIDYRKALKNRSCYIIRNMELCRPYRTRKLCDLTLILRNIIVWQQAAFELTIITNLTNLYPIKMKIYGKKIAQIGNYCQFKAPKVRVHRFTLPQSYSRKSLEKAKYYRRGCNPRNANVFSPKSAVGAI